MTLVVVENSITTLVVVENSEGSIGVEDVDVAVRTFVVVEDVIGGFVDNVAFVVVVDEEHGRIRHTQTEATFVEQSC